VASNPTNITFSVSAARSCCVGRRITWAGTCQSNSVQRGRLERLVRYAGSAVGNVLEHYDRPGAAAGYISDCAILDEFAPLRGCGVKTDGVLSPGVSVICEQLDWVGMGEGAGASRALASPFPGHAIISKTRTHSTAAQTKMKLRTHPFWTVLVIVGSLVSLQRADGSPARHTFAIGTNDFLLDGQRFQIRCGEVHSPRVAREYWQHRCAWLGRWA